jgi:DnaJ-class molecular chaperone
MPGLDTTPIGLQHGLARRGLAPYTAALKLGRLATNTMKDLYQLLGVERSASQEEIKKTYRAMTRQFHPDKNPGDKAAEERFKDISQAYEVLGDERKRALYDEFGEMSLTQGFDAERARAYQHARSQSYGGGYPGGYGGGGQNYGFSNFGDARETSFDDLLSRLFGGGRIDGSAGGDLFGRGGRAGPQSRRGSDINGEIQVSLLDSLLGVTVPLRIEDRSGNSRTLDVRVPEGVTDGAKLRLREQGGPGSPPGDIILTIKVNPGKTLERDGTNLRLEVPVTALEAYRGGPIDIPTPWGPVTMRLPPGTQNGQTLRLRDRGVRIRGEPRGDMLVKIDIRMPEGGDEQLLAALERLQGATTLRREEALG